VPLIAAGGLELSGSLHVSDGTGLGLVVAARADPGGLTIAPGDVTNLHLRSVDGQTVLDWTIVVDQRTLNYEVRKGTSWDTGLVVGDVVAQPPWPTTGDGTYHVRAYSVAVRTRIYSVNTTPRSRSPTRSSRATSSCPRTSRRGWTGGLDGGVIDGELSSAPMSASRSARPWASEVSPARAERAAYRGLCVADHRRYRARRGVPVLDRVRSGPASCRARTFWLTDVLASQDILGTGADPVHPGVSDLALCANRRDTTSSRPGRCFAADRRFAGHIVAWSDWVAIASGTRVSRYFRPGFVLITE
jgi:hypothetical protein